jgi:hypothetical protein
MWSANYGVFERGHPTITDFFPARLFAGLFFGVLI